MNFSIPLTFEPLKRAIIGSTLILCCQGCDMHDFKPTEGHFSAWLREIWDGSLEYEGLYANSDVDSLIFKVHDPNPSDTTDLYREHCERLSNLPEWKQYKAGWYIKTQKAGGLLHNTMEVLRIDAITKETIMVAFIQMDAVPSNDPEEVFQKHSEGKFAQNRLYPKYEEFLAKEKGASKW